MRTIKTLVAACAQQVGTAIPLLLAALILGVTADALRAQNRVSPKQQLHVLFSSSAHGYFEPCG